jgi:penicillin-binding protein 1A
MSRSADNGTSTGRKKPSKRKRRVTFYLTCLVLASLVFLALGFYIFLVTEIPSVKALKDLTNKPVSTIYGMHDDVAYIIVPDNKVFVPNSKIPKYVREAFLAAEDADFYKHKGVDLRSIVRAMMANAVHGRVVQGGSTITQQVIKSLILGPEKSMLRKVREAILAYRLENYLTKQEILNVYLNNIYMGQGVYGIEAASQVYFGKHVWQITRAEAALLAGIVQAPARYTPKRHPGLARMRQLYVIDQLWKKGFVDEKKRDAMIRERPRIIKDDGVFADTYFKNAVVRYVEDKYGKGVFSRRAFKIYATVDPELQRVGEAAVTRGLQSYDERRGEYKASYHLDKGRWENFMAAEQRDIDLIPLTVGTVYNLLVSERMTEGYAVFAGRTRGLLKMADFPFQPGDVVKGVYKTGKKKESFFLPVRMSEIEGALVCMDVKTGYVYAMVGGRDFEKSPYNRALVSKVQPGSAFKPFIYLAALQKGYDLNSTLQDEPKQYSAGIGRSWVPKNYDGTYTGTISLRDAIAYSKNAATVRLLEDVGVSAVRKVVDDLGIDEKIPNDLSIALGTANVTLIDLVKGFSAFANGGERVSPVLVRRVEDTRGKVLEEHGPRTARVIDGEIAYKMNVLLKGVTTYGTAKEASRLGYPVAGKTGTTNSFYDALFVGYSPYVCTGVWVGFDQRASLGKAESGGRVALPIWMNFMASALRRFPADDFGSPAPLIPPESTDSAAPPVTGSPPFGTVAPQVQPVQ